MDPILLFILELVIITAMLYLFLWLRAVSRRVEDRELDSKLDDLEDSVAETTRWLERASEEIREDIESRTQRLQNLLADAEELVETIQRREGALSPRGESDAAPRATVAATESARPAPAESAPEPELDTKGFGDEPVETVRGQPPEHAVPADPIEGDDGARSVGTAAVKWRPPELENEVSARIDAAMAGVVGDEAGGSKDTAADLDEPAPDDRANTDPDERRRRILELVEQEISPVEIAERLGTSRTEVEMVAALHRGRRR